MLQATKGTFVPFLSASHSDDAVERDGKKRYLFNQTYKEAISEYICKEKLLAHSGICDNDMT